MNGDGTDLALCLVAMAIGIYLMFHSISLLLGE